MSSGRVFQVVTSAILALLLIGCGRTPQFSAGSRDLLTPLQTAVSAKQPQWIDAVEEKIAARREAGDVSDVEFEAMSSVIGKARSGDWDGAKSAVFALIDGQRATAEDVKNLEKKKERPVRQKQPRR